MQGSSAEFVNPSLQKAVDVIRERGTVDDLSGFDGAELRVLMSVAEEVGRSSTIIDIGLELDRREELSGRSIEYLTFALLARNRNQEAGDLYSRYLKKFRNRVFDYRPRHDHTSLFGAAEDIASALRKTERERYVQALNSADKFVVWRSTVSDEGEVLLRGAAAPGDDAPVFELTRAGAVVRVSPTVREISRSGYRYFEAVAPEMLPGTVYRYCLVSESGESRETRAAIDGIAPAYLPATAKTLNACSIGVSGACFSGVMTTTGVGGRYRFEYGATPESLSLNSPWRACPPPRTGRVRDRAARHFDHWVPRSTRVGWIAPISGAPAKGERDWSLALIGPFAKDRNQLTGVGSHEMPFNWRWGVSEGEQPTLNVAGGRTDLRDARISFKIGSAGLAQRGSTLTLWVTHRAEDPLGRFWSQWCLTGQPFPDAVFANDGMLRDVTLTLPNDPSMWTYTGNNPIEQGDRANRYRRLPLHETLSECNDAFVLIFLYGDERDPPTGDLHIAEVSAEYRDHSILSPASGARLVAWPDSEMRDPTCITAGSRGYDDALWTSAETPKFPLEFEWLLRERSRVTGVQFNQHPYFPSKDVMLLGKNASTGAWELIAEAHVPDMSSDMLAQPYSYVETNSACEYVSLRLQILSGHTEGRCGLEGLEVYGSGGVFTNDGEPVTISEEIVGLVPGQRIFYRLVVDEGYDDEYVKGEEREIVVPLTAAPLIHDAIPIRRPNNPYCLAIRGNAMGLPTTVAIALNVSQGIAVAGPEIDFGRQPTDRHIYYNLPSGFPETEGVLHIRLTNDAGIGELSLSWPPTWQS